MNGVKITGVTRQIDELRTTMDQSEMTGTNAGRIVFSPKLHLLSEQAAEENVGYVLVPVC